MSSPSESKGKVVSETHARCPLILQENERQTEEVVVMVFRAPSFLEAFVVHLHFKELFLEKFQIYHCTTDKI